MASNKFLKEVKYALRFLPDKWYIQLYYFAIFRRFCNLKNPKTFNEKLNWLKLYDRKPEYSQMVDKYEAKKYVANIIGEEYIIPTLGVWDRFDDIDFDSLPNQFVLKCTHDSEGVVIVKDKNSFDIVAARKKLTASLKQNFFYIGREWPYKNLKPRIIAEKYLVEESENDLKDYKFFCFGGVAKCFKVDFDRLVGHHANYFNMEKSLLEFGEVVCPPVLEKKLEMPASIDKIVELAEKLSKEIPFLRADFYDVNEKVYFGELTFFPASGFGKFTPSEFDKIMGEWIELPNGQGGGEYVIFENEMICIFEQKRHRNIDELVDYKFFCFNGKPKMMYVASDRCIGHTKFDYFDLEFNHFDIRQKYPNSSNALRKPKTFDKMIQLSRKLSEGFPHIRVDFYEVNGALYFGELTFYHLSGFIPFVPSKWDKIFGDWLVLPEINS